MSKAKLIWELMTYVNAVKAFTAQDVANEFNVSVRTAHRYLMELNELGVPLYTEQGRNGGYRVLDNRMLPPILFDENEALAIFFAFQSLKYYKSLPFDTNIESASAKLVRNLPEDRRKKIARLENVLSFWNPKRGMASPFLKEIIEAAAENKVVGMEYASKTDSHTREIAPIGVYAHDGFWYMPAYEMDHEKVQLFRVDRILSLEVLDKTHEAEMGLEDWFNSFIVKTPVRLYVKLNREGMRQCSNMNWLEPHIHKIDENHGYVDTEIDHSELDYVADFFLRLGTSAKIIEPQEVIERIKKQAYQLIDHYL